MNLKSIRILGLLAGALFPVHAAQAEIVTRSVTYEHQGQTLEGYLAYDDALDGPRPGVLIVHAWWGLGDEAKMRARMLAELGYVAFALDMYGQGKLTDDPQVAGGWAGAFMQDRDQMRRRAAAGLGVLRTRPQVDPDRIAAIGYCFGGTTVMELAYAGVDLDGAVSFHGYPKPPAPGDQIKASLLVLHGADDPITPMTAVDAWVASMIQTRPDWQLVIYGGAVHSFTSRSADARGIEGAAYHADADARSWAQMKLFFDEIFNNGK